MDLKTQINKLGQLIDDSKIILVLQPEKPDTDSLASSLALEQILGDIGKTVIMYCQDEAPTYLRHLDGWDRVVDAMPNAFDMTILVDTGGPQMLERTLAKHGKKLSSVPFTIVDHHATRAPMPFDTIDVIDAQSSATGELIFKICQQLGWDINKAAANVIVPSILADTRGLTVPTTTAHTVQVVAEMVKLGANLYQLNQKFRATAALDPDILKLKGKLIGEIEFYNDNKIALIVIKPETLKEYAERHDPSDLVIYEMQGTRGVLAAAVIRHYNAKIKISMRANLEIAAPAAQHFGGGGHPQAAGCTIHDREVSDVKKELIEVLSKLIGEHEAH